MTQLVTGWMTGCASRGVESSKKWHQQLLKDKDGRQVVVCYCLRLEFQNGKRKIPKTDYDNDGGSGSFGRGAVHLHGLMWHADGDVSNLTEKISGTVPIDDPIMTGFFFGSQPSKTTQQRLAAAR